MNELTQEKVLKWKRMVSTEDITRGTNDVVDVAYYTEKDGKRLRLYELKFVDQDEGIWDSTIVLEFVDKYGNPEWRFPTIGPSWHLLESVRYQTAEVEDFLKGLIKDEKS